MDKSNWLAYGKMVGPSKSGEHYCKIFLPSPNDCTRMSKNCRNEFLVYMSDKLEDVRIPGATTSLKVSPDTLNVYFYVNMPNWSDAVTHEHHQQCIQVLEKLHKEGFIHGDVTNDSKPRYNNFAMNEGNVRLIDFEQSRKASSKDTTMEMKEFRSACGV